MGAEVPGTASGRAAGARVRWSPGVARQVLARTRKGETLRGMCREPGMPNVRTVTKWMAQRGLFRRAIEAARIEAGRGAAVGRPCGYCRETAEAIFVRLCGGEALSAICRDPEMPAASTVYAWLAREPQFAEAYRLAREVQADALAAEGWELAKAATPDTAFLAKVRLEHLRWYAAKLGPRAWGGLKATSPAEPPEMTVMCMRRFSLEVDARGWKRVVSWYPDPETRTPVREEPGPWIPPSDGEATARRLKALQEDPEAAERRRAGWNAAPSDPEGWT